MPMLQAILLSAGDFARGALHAKIFPEPIRMQLLDFYSHAAGPKEPQRTSILGSFPTCEGYYWDRHLDGLS